MIRHKFLKFLVFKRLCRIEVAIAIPFFPVSKMLKQRNRFMHLHLGPAVSISSYRRPFAGSTQFLTPRVTRDTVSVNIAIGSITVTGTARTPLLIAPPIPFF